MQTMTSQIHKFVLSNGVRVLVEPVGYVNSAAIGLWCRAGSRHENPGEEGITHFIEHMLFKGTAHRTAKEIAETIEGRGGMLNAFTDKEHTCYYARVLTEETETAVDVLTDMVTGSLLDPEELNREKNVVLEEIKRIQDEPGDYVHDLHLQFRWGEHPLGKTVIGTPESVSSFSSRDLHSYMGRRYRAENLVIAAAGNVNPNEFRDMVERRLAEVASGGENAKLSAPTGQTLQKQVSKDVEQVHFCIGGESCSLYDPELYGVAVLDGILGGGMSSRLFQEVRERRGLAYSIGSYSLNYSAGGAFTIFGGTGTQTWDQVQEVVRKECVKLIRDGVAEPELDKVKRNLKGNMVLALEGMSTRMMRMSKNELNHEREIPLEETLGKIEAVTTEQIQALAGRLLNEKQVSLTAIGPF